MLVINQLSCGPSTISHIRRGYSNATYTVPKTQLTKYSKLEQSTVHKYEYKNAEYFYWWQVSASATDTICITTHITASVQRLGYCDTNFKKIRHCECDTNFTIDPVKIRVHRFFTNQWKRTS